jgi:glycosyltransferase involved in cell wall biosynthesis
VRARFLLLDERVSMSRAATSRPPRLLYLAFYFPPTRASGVHRSLATANYFAARGWDVTVLTVNEDYFRDYVQSWDPSLSERVDPSVRVERVQYDGWRFEPSIRRYGWLRGHFPHVADKLHTRREQREFPEPYATWIRPATARALELHAAQPFDLCLATGNPHAAFAVAWHLHQRAGLPYAVDYRDSWTLNLYEDAPAYPDGHRAWEWERRVLDDASRATFVNEPLREWHAKRYPEAADRMLVVENGWEPTLLGALLALKPHHERPLQFGYLGTMTERVPLAEFFAGWRLARQEPGLTDAGVKLFGHLGYFTSSSTILRGIIPVDEGIGVSYEGPVAKTEVAAAYDSVDVLLLALAGSKYVTSGKVYEYMATGKPIVSVHVPEAAASDVLRGYPLWFPCADLSPEAIREALVKAADAARVATPEDSDACRAYAAAYTREAQLEPFERELRQLVGDVA